MRPGPSFLTVETSKQQTRAGRLIVDILSDRKWAPETFGATVDMGENVTSRISMAPSQKVGRRHRCMADSDKPHRLVERSPTILGCDSTTIITAASWSKYLCMVMDLTVE